MNKHLDQEEQTALELDRQDPLSHFREQFTLPPDTIYFCNNSLGLPPKATFKAMQEQLQRWSELGVEGWFQGKGNWYTSFDLAFGKTLSQILGAHSEEVVVMNSLTVNLHLLLVSFYQPSENRFKILMESPLFPSDLYAIKSHIRYHGLDPDQVLIIVEPRPGEHLLRQEDIEEVISQKGDEIALVFISSVNFLTGQVLDIEAISKLAKAQGCIVGVDIAHAAGNIPLKLHQWRVDFAVGCSYKYLCSGPGGPGIAYVHAYHHKTILPRFSGWWGNDPSKRFQMQLSEFVPAEAVHSWQVSTPSILSMTPLLTSMELFNEAGMLNLRKKSEMQTAFLIKLLEKIPHSFEIITPKNPEQRGSQLSLLILHQSERCLQNLADRRVICDFRPPNIIRVTPSPFYNTFYEIYQFACRFTEALVHSK